MSQNYYLGGITGSCVKRIPMVALLLFFIVIMVAASGLPARANQVESLLEGLASWYGTTAHGKQTASGEIYDRNALTAAHKTIPFGTVVRVHNLKNGKHVLVGITDRGPFIEGRVVDLSLRAAHIMGLVEKGTAPVSIELVSDKSGTPLDPASAFYIRLTDAESKSQAMQITKNIAKNQGRRVKFFKLSPNSSIVSSRVPGQLGALAHYSDSAMDALFDDSKYVVCLGPFQSFKDARALFVEVEEALAPKEIIEGPVVGLELPDYAPPTPDNTYRAAKKPVRQPFDEHVEAGISGTTHLE